MKILGIIFLFSGSMWGVKTHLDTYKEQISQLKQWQKILDLWRIWLVDYSYSLEELLEQTGQNVATKHLPLANTIKFLNLKEIILFLKTDSNLPEEQRSVLIQLFREFGRTLKEDQANELKRCSHNLAETLNQKEKTIKERSALLYKLTPLLIGAVAIMLW